MNPHFKLSRTIVATLAAALFTAPILHAAADPDPDLPMQELISRYRADDNQLNRFYESLRPSPFLLDRDSALYKDWLDKLGAHNFDSLDQQGRIDYLLLRDYLRHEEQVAARDRAKLASIDALLPFRATIQELETARVRMQPLDAQAAATKITSMPDQIKKLRERIERGRKEPKKDDAKKDEPKKDAPSADQEKPKNDASKSDDAPIKLDALQAKRAADAADELRRAFKGWNDFYDGYMPEYSWWMKKPYEDAGKSIEEYAKYLREEIAGIKGKDEDPLIGDPLGPQAVAEDLARESIPYAPDELIKIAEKEFSWCEDRMKETSREMGLGDDWKAALAKVKDIHEPPGKQDQLIAAQAHEAIEFVKSRDLVTIPKFCEETWRVQMLGIDAQKTMPYAAYNGMQLLAAYPRQDMKHEDKLMSLRGNNSHFQRIVTAHELIPGHHLQAWYAQRYRQYRDMFWTSFYVEGWALYWEMKLWDLGYARGPEDRMGMLFWRMHRCARIIVSLKYHLGRMQPKEMIDFLVERVGHERFGATSEVRRFIIYPPLYQCGYMLGGMQLRALREEMVGKRGMSDKEFNDSILKYGPIPIEYIRDGMLNISLTRDTKPAWRFGE